MEKKNLLKMTSYLQPARFLSVHAPTTVFTRLCALIGCRALFACPFPSVFRPSFCFIYSWWRQTVSLRVKQSRTSCIPLGTMFYFHFIFWHSYFFLLLLLYYLAISISFLVTLVETWFHRVKVLNFAYDSRQGKEYKGQRESWCLF
jgi:hypothetical protein